MRRGRVRTRVWSLGAIAAAIALIVGATAVPASADPVWSITASPNPAASVDATLNGVACTSASSCFAVGNWQSASGHATQLLEHWNGSAWSMMANPPGVSGTSLQSVSCPSAANCFAVGNHSNSTLTEHWNGRSWSIVASPSPKGSHIALHHVACPGKNNCFAVGDFRPTGNEQRPLAEHWNGKRWSIVPVPSPSVPYTSLAGVTCPSPRNCFAVGSRTPGNGISKTLVEHWNGSRWAIMTSANESPAVSVALRGVSCPSTTMCFAVGNDSRPTRSNPDTSPLIEQWNGSHWSLVASPVESPHNVNALADAVCTSTTNCFAVGISGEAYGPDGGQGVHTLVQHWDGASWSTVTSPSPAGSDDDFFQAVTCTGAAGCLGVGQFAGPQTCTDSPPHCTQPLYTLAERYA